MVAHSLDHQNFRKYKEEEELNCVPVHQLGMVPKSHQNLNFLKQEED